MTDEPMTTLDAALLAYSMDELQAMDRNSRMLLGARVARELRRRMELTHFHPALFGLRRSIAHATREEEKAPLPQPALRLSELDWD